MFALLPTASLAQLLLEAADRPLWAVDLPRQRMLCCDRNTTPEIMPISSSATGIGNRPESRCTPLGWHAITDIIGTNAPLGQPFVSRKPAGPPLTDWLHGEGDAILTRVLVLQGLQPVLNGNSHARYIYLHGTHQEALLGTPASCGCIRMRNRDIARLADACQQIPPSHWPHVWIGACRD